jgi:DNA-binding beta-propeller fold protein YncE
MRISVLACAACVACAAAPERPSEDAQATTGATNPVTGEGLPNPNPTRVGNWATLPEGRMWGSSAGLGIDPLDGHVWGYERCGAGALAGAGIDCDTNPVDPIFKFDRDTGAILANFGAGIFVTPHGLHVDAEGNVWVTDFARNAAGTKGHQVHKFSPDGQLLMSLGTAGRPGREPGQLNQPNDVVVAPDGSIFVSDGHAGQGLLTDADMAEARAMGLTGRIVKFSSAGEYLLEWGEIGTEHGEFRTPHAMAFDAQGRLWIADRGNHRLEIYDQQGTYLESRYIYGRVSDLFITAGQMVYAIDSESDRLRHQNWSNGVRIGPVDRDVLAGFIPPWESDTRPGHGVAGEGIGVDADGNVYVAEGPASLADAGAAFTKYVVAAAR